MQFLRGRIMVGSLAAMSFLAACGASPATEQPNADQQAIEAGAQRIDAQRSPRDLIQTWYQLVGDQQWATACSLLDEDWIVEATAESLDCVTFLQEEYQDDDVSGLAFDEAEMTSGPTGEVEFSRSVFRADGSEQTDMITKRSWARETEDGWVFTPER